MQQQQLQLSAQWGIYLRNIKRATKKSDNGNNGKQLVVVSNERKKTMFIIIFMIRQPYIYDKAALSLRMVGQQ